MSISVSSSGHSPPAVPEGWRNVTQVAVSANHARQVARRYSTSESGWGTESPSAGEPDFLPGVAARLEYSLEVEVLAVGRRLGIRKGHLPDFGTVNALLPGGSSGLPAGGNAGHRRRVDASCCTSQTCAPFRLAAAGLDSRRPADRARRCCPRTTRGAITAPAEANADQSGARSRPDQTSLLTSVLAGPQQTLADLGPPFAGRRGTASSSGGGGPGAGGP
jgi:hypothetical protein